jgi:hypothetical protein
MRLLILRLERTRELRGLERARRLTHALHAGVLVELHRGVDHHQAGDELLNSMNVEIDGRAVGATQSPFRCLLHNS